MARVMKDSGVEWIGEIPVDWNIYKGKLIFKQRSERGNDVPIQLAATQKYGMYPQSLLDGVVQVNIGTDIQQFKTVHINDFVISLRSFQGGFEISDYEGVCSPAYQVFYSIIPINHRFYKYLFKSDGFISKMNSLTVGIREGKNIQYKDFSNSFVLYPSQKEQCAIASILDSKCQEIDNVLAKTRSSIEEYKKLKQAIITKAVTKGIRKNRKMKDSGIEWIGEIPEEWPLYISRFCIDYIADVDHYMPESIDAGVPYIMTGDLKDKISKIDFKQCKQISFDDYKKLSNKIVAEKGDIILARYATIGTTCYVDIDSEFIVSYSCVIIKLDKTKLRGYYLFYYFKSLMFIEETIRLAKSNTQSNLGIEELYSFRIPLPDLTEQQIIIDYLDLKCSELDNLIKKKEQLISELESYKKSLIYEYVTGKKEVPTA